MRAGWDFPWWTYEYFLHGRSPEPGPIDIGSRTCWHAGDLLALLKFLFGRGEAPTPEGKRGMLYAILQFLGDFAPGIHADLFRWDDPLPAVAELWPYISRLRGAIGGSAGSLSKMLDGLFAKSPGTTKAIGA